MNPYGVIFSGDKAYVGSPHGKPISLSADVKKRVLDLAKRFGVWYEGDGGDIAVNSTLFGDKRAYRGSWDDAFAKTVKGYPPEYLSVMFSNVDVNRQKKVFLAPAMSIFDSLLKHQTKKRFFKDREYTSATLTQFLRMVSDDKYNFLELSKKRATKENVDRFFSAGEARMFPKDWDKYPHPAGKVMKKVEDARNQFLLGQKSGVAVVGAGHLIEMLKLDKSLKMIGGSKAHV